MLSSLPAVANLPAPAPTGNTSEKGDVSDNAEGGSFAQALDQATGPSSPAARARVAAAAKAAAAPVDRGIGAAPNECLAPDCEPLAADSSDSGEGSTAEGEPVAPTTVCTLLADLQSRALPTPVVAGGPGGKTAADTADKTLAPLPGIKEGKGGNELLRPATQPRQAEPPLLPADRHPLPSPLPPAAVAPDRGLAAAERAAMPDAEPLPQAVSPITPSTLAAPAAAPPLTAAPASVANTVAAAEAQITAHPASAEFGAQLGATITTFVREGIEHARLNLHPAELGPVQVQIQLDGANAQVLLGAEHALTREKLEQSLPLLASTLREAGLTLAGGGVFQQAGQGNGSSAGDGRRGSERASPKAGAAVEPAARAVVRSRGVVDLVA